MRLIIALLYLLYFILIIPVMIIAIMIMMVAQTLKILFPKKNFGNLMDFADGVIDWVCIPIDKMNEYLENREESNE